ncbi:MAG: HD domain-containing protein [Hyphomicrobiaceae bacterium]|nr:HD domain-containing protein [Hyphomicrobiaceae bacterium]
MTDLDRAIVFATEAHAGQLDKNGAPYILHPLRMVSSLARIQTIDEATLCAAVLHDTVEDCDGVRLGDILALFGSPVHRLVDALTRRKGEDYGEYIERVAVCQNATLIKLADLEDNLDPSRGPVRPNIDRYLQARTYLMAVYGNRAL